MLRRTVKAEHPEQEGDERGPSASILVVNDDEGACELLVRLLTNGGHRVQRAMNADQALGQLSVGGFDCVVLDLTSGGIGQNLKLLDAIRSSVTASIARVRVLLIAQQASNRMFSWQAGIDGFLVRPFHADELFRQVREVLVRPDDARAAHRRQELDAASAQGRSGIAEPWTPESQG